MKLYYDQNQPIQSHIGFVLELETLLIFLESVISDKLNALWYHRMYFNIENCVKDIWINKVWSDCGRKKTLINSVFW